MALGFVKTYFIVGAVAIGSMVITIAAKRLLQMTALSATATLVGVVALNVLHLIGICLGTALLVSAVYCSFKRFEKPTELLKGIGVSVIPIALIIVSICVIAISAGVSPSEIFIIL